MDSKLSFLAGILLVFAYSSSAFALEDPITIDFSEFSWNRIVNIPDSIDWTGKELNLTTLRTEYLYVTNTTVVRNVTVTDELHVENVTALNDYIRFYNDINFTEYNILTGYTLNEWRQSYTDANERTGFPNSADSTISFNETTRNLTIEPTSDYFLIYQANVIYNKTTAEQVQITDVEGLHIIYYDEGVLNVAENPSIAAEEEIIRLKVTVSTIYWDATNNHAIYFGEERHGMQMDGATHAMLHFTRGLQYISGLALNSILADESGDLDTHAQFGVDAGTVQDEDLSIATSAELSTVGLPIFYRDGTDGDWRNATNPGFSVLTTGTGRLAWNEFSGGTWSLTEVGDNNFVLYHVFASTKVQNQTVSIVGQNEYNTIPAAREGAVDEIGNLLLGDLPGPELLPIGTVIFQTRDLYANSVNARIRTTDLGDDYVDFRFAEITRTAAVTSHSVLSDLSNDDHLQYLRTDGTRDLTGNWVVSTNNIDLTNGILTANTVTDGTMTMTGGVISSPDGDSSHIFGRARVGYGNVVDKAMFTHRDQSTTGVGIAQSGQMELLAPAGQNIQIKPSGDTNDYWAFSTSSDIPILDSLGLSDPIIRSDAGYIQLRSSSGIKVENYAGSAYSDIIAADITATTLNLINDTAYGDSWNGTTTHAPSQNAVYDKLEDMEVFNADQPYAYIKLAGTQSIADDTDTKLDIGDEDVIDDDWGFMDDGNSQLEVPSGMSGVYVVVTDIAWAANAVGIRVTSLYCDTELSQNRVNAVSGTYNYDGSTVTWVGYLDAGDVIYVNVYQDSTGSLNVQDGSSIGLVRVSPTAGEFDFGADRFVWRGEDDSASDWTHADLTEDGTWRDLDMSSIVDSGATAVLLRVLITDETAGLYLKFRAKGDSTDYANAAARTEEPNVVGDTMVITGLDSSGVAQYQAQNTAWTDIGIVVCGWWVPSNTAPLLHGNLDANDQDVENGGQFDFTQPFAWVSKDAIQSVPDSTWTAINWTVEDSDVGGMHTSTANPRLTIPTGMGGIYQVSSQVRWATGTGVRYIAIRINGSNYQLTNLMYADAGETVTHATNGMLVLPEGSYIETAVYQTSGGALNAETSYNWLQATRISTGGSS